MSSPLLGMVARRDGVMLGRVVFVDPAGMVTALAEDGSTSCSYVGHPAMSFHPAPTPTQGQAVPACILEAIGDADGWDDQMCAVYIRNSLESLEAVRAALGMEGKAMGAVLKRIRELVEGEGGDEYAYDAAYVAEHMEFINRPTPSAPTTPEEEWVSDPPPPAPEGEERWYGWWQLGHGPYDMIRVVGRGYKLVESGSERVGAAVFAIEDWSEESTERRSRHPVLPPLWASDAWTTEPLPAPPETGSVWWGFDFGENVEVVEQRTHWLRIHFDDGSVGGWCAARPNIWEGKRRTRSPIERPRWAREEGA